jgi:predicted flap endonuclease-1-like 5' DNA nuclease
MIALSGFCDIHWLISWILPFLLGLALGLWLWFRYKGKSQFLKDQIDGYTSTINDLEQALAKCKSKRIDLEGELALTKGKMREMENDISRIRKEAGKSSSRFTRSETSNESEQSFAPYYKLKDGNLQIIEGIGPKMEALLKENNVNTWKALSELNPKEIRDILNKYGDKYKIIDPQTWSQQAKLASAADWKSLVDLQRKLAGGKKNAQGLTESKVEKVLIKLGLIKKYKQNDLKLVEGIGPKIEKLLIDAGIDTWEKLGHSKVEDLQAILDEAGSRFSLADPSSWPKQGELADQERWKELENYQDFLQGGK